MSTENFFSEKKGWSKIKDRIIAHYLKPYAAKVLQNQKPLKIIDCFAGKGKFDDGENGSPIIIANTILDILNNTKDGVYANKQVSACFIEKKYFKELKINTKACEKCETLEGGFEDHIDKITHDNNNINLFLYIDPYGIKNLSFDIFNTLKSSNNATTEFLMNFNSFGFLREGFRLLKYAAPKELNEDIDFEIDNDKNTIARMDRIANGTYWQDIINAKNANEISMLKAEELFASEYIKQLKTIYKYVINIPIKIKKVNLPKYRLVFGTNHPHGVGLMLDKMHEAWYELTPKGNGFDYFDEPDYYATETHKTPETAILRLSENKIHIQELILKLIDIFGIKYKVPHYIEMIKSMSKKPEQDLFSTQTYTQKLNVTREYKTKNGNVPTDWDWNNKIYIESIK